MCEVHNDGFSSSSPSLSGACLHEETSTTTDEGDGRCGGIAAASGVLGRLGVQRTQAHVYAQHSHNCNHNISRILAATAEGCNRGH